MTWLSNYGLRNSNLLSNVSVFTFLVLLMLVPSGYAFGPALLFLASLWCLLTGRFKTAFNTGDIVLSTVFVFYFLSFFFIIQWHQDDFSIDRASKFVFAAMVLFYLKKFPFSSRVFWSGCIVACWVLGIFAIAQMLLYHQFSIILIYHPGGLGHAQTYENTIYFGSVCLTFALICLSGVIWAQSQSSRKNVWIIMLLIGFVLSMTGSILSGSRGGWITLPFVLIILLKAYSSCSGLRKASMILAAPMLAFIILLFIPNTPVHDRAKEAYQETQYYLVKDREATSIGIRLEQWKSAFLAVKYSPWLGQGFEGYKQFEKQLIEDETLIAEVHRFRHLHNIYFDAMAKQGLIGLMFICLVFAVPFVLFFKQINSADLKVKAYATAGSSFVLMFSIMSLTESYFYRNAGVMIYAFMVIYIWSAISVKIDAKS